MLACCNSRVSWSKLILLPILGSDTEVWSISELGVDIKLLLMDSTLITNNFVKLYFMHTFNKLLDIC